MKIIKHCAVCNKEFEPCTVCGEAINWRKVVCCAEHFVPHIALLKFRDGNMKEKEEAVTMLKEAIKNYGKINFSDDVKNLADEMLKVKKAPEKKEEKE